MVATASRCGLQGWREKFFIQKGEYFAILYEETKNYVENLINHRGLGLLLSIDRHKLVIHVVNYEMRRKKDEELTEQCTI